MNANADLCRRAAVTLREHAESATDGNWRVAPEIQESFLGRPTVVRTSSGNMRIVSIVENPASHTRAEGNIAYIALMHPPVALAMARMLENEADVFEDEDITVDEVPSGHLMLDLAKAILREE